VSTPDKDHDILPVEFGIRNDDSIWLQIGTPLKTSYSAGDVNLTPWAVATIARRCNDYAAIKVQLATLAASHERMVEAMQKITQNCIIANRTPDKGEILADIIVLASSALTLARNLNQAAK
jgi:hypothetical protein